MREILFRGKATQNNGVCTPEGEWIKGHLVNAKNAIEDEARSYIIEDAEYYTHGEFSSVYEVDPETVGQFTGLTDKNGNRIFEGDIVIRVFTLWHGETKKTRNAQIGVVVYSNRDCSFQVEKKCNLRKPWDGDTIEVIGNIHDNPELLESEDTE